MQTFQLAILVLFETSDELSYRELQEATLLSEDQLTRHIQSLTDCKLLDCNDKVCFCNSKILGMGENTIMFKSCFFLIQEITKDSVIQLNKSYANKRSKFRISGAVQKETPQEVEQTHVAVEEDRKIFMQAAIVRIMKSRKVIKHNVLIQEVKVFSN